MPAPPRISVVVPFRNRASLLRDLLAGLAAQTYGDAEVILVDDGSTDGAAAAADGVVVGGRPVRVLRQEPAGAVAAREAGVAIAEGELLAFTDSDCVPEPDWLAAGVAALDAGADVVQGRTIPARKPGLLERTLSSEGDALYQTCNVFYRRSAFDAAGGFDTDGARRWGFRPTRHARGLGFGEDTALGWRVRRGGRAVYEPSAVVRHHVFGVDLHDHLSRTLQAGAFPALVGELPELRRTLLRWRLFLGRGRGPLYLATVAALLRRPTAAVALSGLWVGAHWRRASRAEPELRRRLKALPVLLASDAVAAGALVAGSARARTPVL